MQQRQLIYAVLAVGLTTLAYLGWKVLAGSKGARRSKKKRKSDRVALKGPQLKIYKQAQALLEQGNVLGSAQLLESLQMFREAVNLLEAKRHIKEAAAVLLRLRRPNRAGVIYMKHGMHQEAADCFAMANMPLEVARCAKECGDLSRAVKYFLQAKQFEEAADCYLEIGQHREAAKLYADLGMRDKAIEVFHSLLESADNIKDLSFGENEIKIMADHLAQGQWDAKIADVIVQHGRLIDVLLQLIGKGLVKPASELYLRSTSDIGPQLVSKSDLSAQETKALAQVFMTGASFEYAGMLFERLGDFGAAGEAFERAEDFERAAYCYERAKLKDKAVDMRCRIAATGKKGAGKAKPNLPPPPGPKANLFAMGESSNALMQSEENLSRTRERTVIDDSYGDREEPKESPSIEGSFSIGLEEEADEAAAPPVAAAETKGERTVFDFASFVAELDPNQKILLWNISEALDFEPGATILDFDNEPRGIYFVIAGQVSCHRETAAGVEEVDKIRAGGTFGEYWLLIGLPTKVRFLADQASRLRVMDRWAFTDLLDRNGTLARKIYKHFAQSLLRRLVTNQHDNKNRKSA